ncbi:phage minor capsid protein [Limosilactobacillus fermentum]|uniref:phage minor capsid protein n=1 Tax=Limosilactobacillus fermentum TaxID=1613 RepID=UPI003D777A42
MGAREQFERAASKISDYYQALEQQIFALIVDALKKGDYKHVDQKDVVMWQAKQLSKIGQLNRQVIKLMSKKDGISQKAIEDMIKSHGMAIADEIDSQLERLTDKHPGVSNEVNLLVSGIAQQTWTDLQNNVNESLVSRNYGQSAVTKAYRQVLTESTTATVTGLMTHADAVQSAMYRVVDKGLPTNLTDKAGRNWSLEGYTRMVVNTTVNRTFSEVRLQRMSDFDMHLALMSAHPNSRPACAPIQGHVVNLVPASDPAFNPHYDTIYNHGYGDPAGTQGINCRHILFPYEPGVSENHQPQYDPDEAIKNGKLVQQQRARERAIRDAKKRLAVAEQLSDENMVSQTKTLLSARQAKIRQFISDTNAGKDPPILTRDYAREKIVNQV